MTKRIVQCVPNVSEGRDLAKLDNILKPMRQGQGYKLVSAEPDKDYNRTVITLLGDPEAMLDDLLAMVGEAVRLIDMNVHRGEHPRMGAVDVVPFIPIAGVTMEECVEYAKRLAECVASVYNVPVFLYAKAASRDNRIALPDIRKGEFEGMKEKIRLPEWAPDYGTPDIHPTFGCVAIGARMPLVAYNIDLDTKEEKIASAISKAIRQSSGGFQHIQAGPATLEARGHVQVTMNILDFKKNPIYRIFETVRMEARRYQVECPSAEIVGLLPKEALEDSVKYYVQCLGQKPIKDIPLETLTQEAIRHLRLRDFDRSKIIESYLDER
jgi:glutamate formiminotransferase